MPRKPSPVPPFCVHRATGQAYVRIDGRRVYLGKADHPDVRERYTRTLAEWAAAGGRLPVHPDELTVCELMDRYLEYVRSYYRRPDGTLTGEIGWVRSAMRFLRELYGGLPVRDFSPLKLRAVRDAMVRRGCPRRVSTGG